MSRRKYPRTPHLPWSPGATADDVLLNDCSALEGEEVVVTEKMDGENTTIYADHVHARSLDSAHHPSRTAVKQLQATLSSSIPAGWRLCGENLQARHSIAYDSLPAWFLLFSIWDEQDQCLPWDQTLEWAELLELQTVPVLWRGAWEERALRRLCEGLDTRRQEGLVVRRAGPYSYAEFGQCVAKWVRADHVTTDQHWMHGPMVPNGLRRQP
jgi:hypothetical protein